MAKSQDCSFLPPPRILTRGKFLLLVTLYTLLATVPALADVYELTTSQSGTQNWNSSDTFTVRNTSESNIIFVHNDFYLRSPSTSNNETFDGYIYLGYDYNSGTNTFSVSETSGNLALKNQANKTITVTNLYLGNGSVLGWQGNTTPTLAGNIYVESSKATIDAADSATFYLTSTIVKNTPDAVLNLTPKNVDNGIIYIKNSSNVNCPLNLTKGTLIFDGSNTFGSNFALTLQNGTTAILSDNFIGVAGTSIVINGSVRYEHWQNTSANKVCFSNLIVSEGSTLTASNSNSAGAKGSMVFAGDLQGAGTLVVDTVGSTNTNSLTLGHSENSFTGTVSVTRGKLQFTVLGADNVTYAGTNALVNAASVAVASGATIDVGTTTQTLKNLSGAGNITLGSGGALSLSNTTSDTEFSGVISGSGSLTKNGAKSLTLSGTNTYEGGTTISDGTLKMTGTGTLGTGAVTNSGTLEFNNSTATITPNISGAGDILVSAGTASLTGAVTQTGGATTLANGTTLSIGNASTLYNLAVVDEDSSATLNITGNLTLNNSDLTKFIGSITAPVVTKTGLDTLQLCFDAVNAVNIGSLVVSSGRVDLKGYMQGGITVEANGVFSPGNSVGEAKFGGGYELYEGAKLLIEMDETGIDTLTASSFIENGGIIELVIDGIPNGTQYDVITATNGFSVSQDEAYWLGKFGTLPDYMTLSVVDGVYGANSQTVRLSLEQSAAVPEPSTWVLLFIGAAGLLYVRKRTHKK